MLVSMESTFLADLPRSWCELDSHRPRHSSEEVSLRFSFSTYLNSLNTGVIISRPPFPREFSFPFDADPSVLRSATIRLSAKAHSAKPLPRERSAKRPECHTRECAWQP